MNSSSKPFESKSFFLDLSSYPHNAKLSKDLVQLGAKEVFSIPSASFVVSDRPSIKSDCNSPTPFSGPRSNSPLFKDSALDYVNSPTVHSPSYEQKYVGERVKPMSRGLSILMKANEKGVSHKKDAILDLCKRWNVKIYPLQKVLKFIEKYKQKHFKSHSLKKKYESEDVSKIIPPYIKIEDAKRQFRPKYKSLSSPKIVDSVLFKCVKNLVKNTKQSTDVKEFARPVLQEMSVMTQISRNEQLKTEPVSVTKPPGFNSVSNSMSICGPSTLVKEENRKQHHVNKIKKEKKKVKKEYCEICQIHYTIGEAHFEKESHKKFLENSENFAELKKIISSLPCVEDFVAKLEEEEHSKEVFIDDFQLLKSSVSIENDDPSKPKAEYGCSMTERYSLNEEEIISSSCTCPSTPLPFLQERESVKDIKSLADNNKLRNDLSAFSIQGILSQNSHASGYNSHKTDSRLCENFSHIPETLHSNNIHYPNIDNDYNSPLNLSCDNQIGILCPVQRIGNVLPFAEKQVNVLECSSKTLLTVGEYLNGCETLCLSTDYYASSMTPLDLSHDPTNLKEQEILRNSIDAVDNIVQNDFYCVVDITEAYADSKCIADGINFVAVDITTSIDQKNLKDVFWDNPQPVPSFVNSINIENKMNGSNGKNVSADCDTEIYSSDPESENLNKIVASCIEEVNKDLENISPTVSNELNNEFFNFDTVKVNSRNECPVRAMDSDDSTVETIIPIKDVLLNNVSTEFSIVKDFNNSFLESPPAKRMRLQSQTSLVLNDALSKSLEQSNVHEQLLPSTVSVEPVNEVTYFQEKSCMDINSIRTSNFSELSPDDESPPVKKIRLDLLSFPMSDEPNNKLFRQSSVHDEEITGTSGKSLYQIAHFDEKNSVVKENQTTLEFPNEFKTPINSSETKNCSELSKQLNIANLNHLPLSKTESETKVSECSNCSLNVSEMEMNLTTCSVMLENYNISNKVRKSSNFMKLCKNETLNHISCESNPVDIDLHSDIDLDQPPILESVINFAAEIVESSEEIALSNIDDSSMPPILELEINVPSKIIENSEELHTEEKEAIPSKPAMIESLINNNMPSVSDNVNPQLQLGAIDSPSKKYAQNQCLNANTGNLLQSIQDESNFSSKEDISNNLLVCTSGTTSSEVHGQNADFFLNLDKLKIISKAMEEYNISSEEFNCHDIFIVLDETSDDSETLVDPNASSELQNYENIKSESSNKSLKEVIGNTEDENENQSSNSVTFMDIDGETDVPYIVANDKMDYALNSVYIDPEKKSEKEHIDEEIKACLNAVICNVEIHIMETDATDNVVNVQTDIYFDNDSDKKLTCDVRKEELQHVDVTIDEEINACVNDLINDIESSDRETNTDTNFDRIQKEQPRATINSEQYTDVVNERNINEDHSCNMEFSNYSNYNNICDKEIKIVIPKLSPSDICQKELKIIIPKLTVSECLYLSRYRNYDKFSHTGQNRISNIRNSRKVNSSTINNIKDYNTPFDASVGKNIHVSDIDIKMHADEKSNGNDFNTSDDDDEDANYNIRKVGSMSEKTLSHKVSCFSPVCDTSEEANSSVNENSSFNASDSEMDSRISNNSVNTSPGNYSSDFCSGVVESYANLGYTGDVEHNPVHVVYLNSPQF